MVNLEFPSFKKTSPAMKRSTMTMFAQMVQMLNTIDFANLVHKYQTDKHAKGITTRDQFIAMLYCQLASCDSLREIADGLNACVGKLNHVNAKPICRSSLSYVNSKRDYRLYEEFYYVLMNRFKSMIQGRALSKRYMKPVYSLDSTTISVCLSLFNWAHYRRKKGAIKLHTLLNQDYLLPEMMVMTDGKVSDIRAAKSISIPSDSIVIMDRGYNDFAFFKDLSDRGITFITRLKDNAKTTPFKEGMIAEDEATHWGDYRIEFTGLNAVRIFQGDYGFRVIQWHDIETDRWYEFLTNEVNPKVLSETDIALLYRDRWQIELFFKRIKQNLVIRSFVGTSANAVMVQIWTAAIAILILEVLKRRSKYPWSFSRLANYFRLNLMTCKSLVEWLERPDIMEWEEEKSSQYELFYP